MEYGATTPLDARAADAADETGAAAASVLDVEDRAASRRRGFASVAVISAIVLAGLSATSAYRSASAGPLAEEARRAGGAAGALAADADLAARVAGAAVLPTQAPVSMVSTGKPTLALIMVSPKPTPPGHVVLPSSAKKGVGADSTSTPPGSGDKHAPGWHQHKASTSCVGDGDCSDKYLCEQGSCVPYQPDTSIGAAKELDAASFVISSIPMASITPMPTRTGTKSPTSPQQPSHTPTPRPTAPTLSPIPPPLPTRPGSGTQMPTSPTPAASTESSVAGIVYTQKPSMPVPTAFFPTATPTTAAPTPTHTKKVPVPTRPGTGTPQPTYTVMPTPDIKAGATRNMPTSMPTDKPTYTTQPTVTSAIPSPKPTSVEATKCDDNCDDF